MNTKIKLFFNGLAILTATVVVIVIAQKGLAWTNPTANPPFGGQAINVSGGNVGIGNATPVYKLDVSGDVNFTGTLRQNGTPFSAGNQWATNGTNIYNTNTGNVGIGTASPSNPLHVQKSASGNYVMLENTDGTTSGAYSEMGFRAGARSGYIWVRNQTGGGEGDGAFNIYSETGDVNLWAGATRIVNVRSNGNVGIGTTDPTSQMAGTYGVAVYNANYPAIGFKNSTTNWLWYGNGSTLRMWNNSAGDILSANTSGNVGIGTTAPTYKLQVEGSIYANGGWLRSSGTTGWYNETYGGGWYMEDPTWIRSYNNKNVYVAAQLRTDGGLVSGPIGSNGAGTLNTSSHIYSGGDIYFAGANPYLSASSYFIAPGGAYFNSGTVYMNAQLQARGGIHNDNSSYLSIDGGTSGVTYVSGKMGIGTTAPISTLSVGGAGVASAGIYGYNGGSYGVYGESSQAGGGIGVWGTGATGVYGYGASGVVGYSTLVNGNASGVYGYANTISGIAAGVYGQNGAATGIGVKGSGYYGLYGSGSYGLWASGSIYGIMAGGTGAGSYGVQGSGNAYDFYANGAGVNYGAPSSGRWKKNVTPINDILGKISNISTVYFDWDEEHGGQRDLGFIGEEVGKYFPEVVAWDKDAPGFVTGMDYSKMTPILLGAIKEQQVQIEKKQSTIDDLMKRVERLESIVN